MSDSLEPKAGRPRSLRGPLAVGLVVAVVLTAFVLVWFQPQKLLFDDRVDEAAPDAGTGHTTAGPGPTEVPGPPQVTSTAPIELARGTFVPLDHATSGTVRVLETGGGSRVVRLEGFETENGPDLYVYLTANRAGGDEGGFDDEFVSLGRLKGNQGDQNYDVPGDADLSRFSTVVIWCDRFNSPFGAADLSDGA